MEVKTREFDVFLSYQHVDADSVERLAVRLDQSGFRVWLDQWVLVPGKQWQHEIAQGLEQARTCAVFIGQNTPDGWFKQEIQRALNRQAKDAEFRVIPVILPGGTSARADDFLELRTWIDFKLGMDDQIAFHRLCAGIRGECPGRPELPHLEPRLEKVSERLKQIRSLRKVELIDDSVAVEYQRRLLDHLVE